MSTIVVRDVHKRFGRNEVLRGVSLELRPGEVVGLLGANGAGKSTLLRVICGLDAPDQGTVLRNPTNPDASAASRIGAMLDPRWVDSRFRCSEHVTIAMLARGITPGVDDVQSALEQVGLGEHGAVRAGRLSLGMRQRLALCLAMIDEPSVLVLDEPVNGLDPEGVMWLRQTVRSFADSGGTVLLSSHLMAEMELVADRVVVLAGGRSRDADRLAEWGQASSVVVETRGQIDPLIAAVIGAGGHADLTGAHVACVSGMPAGTVFELAVGSKVVLTRLDTQTVSLEDFYRAVTTSEHP